MNRDDQEVWDDTLRDLRAQRDLDPLVLDRVSVALTALAVEAQGGRGVVLLLVARLVYVLANEDG